MEEQVAEDTREGESDDFPSFIRNAVDTWGRGPGFKNAVVDDLGGGRGDREGGVL